MNWEQRRRIITVFCAHEWNGEGLKEKNEKNEWCTLIGANFIGMTNIAYFINRFQRL